MPHILVVDDDSHIRDVICFALKKADHTYEVAATGREALSTFNAHTFDLIVLDIGLPEMDGFDVCREVRKVSEIPILFLSARDEEIDRILGLEMGGDDYVTKPFSPRELVARVSAILKRATSVPQSAEPEPILEHGPIILDADRRLLTVHGTALDVTALEFNIMRGFLDRPRMAFTRNQIIETAYPDNIHVSDRTIDSHIRNIRAKLTAAGCDGVIETVHGVGFRLGTLEALS